MSRTRLTIAIATILGLPVIILPIASLFLPSDSWEIAWQLIGVVFAGQNAGIHGGGHRPAVPGGVSREIGWPAHKEPIEIELNDQNLALYFSVI